jgi:hypothetical protein
MAHQNIDLSSGSYGISKINGVRYLSFQGAPEEELSEGNSDYWNIELGDVANSNGFSTGYEMANAYFAGVKHKLEVTKEESLGGTWESRRDDAFASMDEIEPAVPFSIPAYGDLTQEQIDTALENVPPIVFPADSTLVAEIEEEIRIENEAAENIQDDADADGLLIDPPGGPEILTPPVQPTQAANILEDQSYPRIVDGWNQKLEASSQKISSLVPFCELYAVFDQNDIVTQENEWSTRYTAIASRMMRVNFAGPKQGDTPTEPALPDGLSPDCYVVKVAGDNKSQLSTDSAIQGVTDTGRFSGELDPYKSYKGVPGIGDLAVSRGSAAAQNVKYDLSITLPNPELINERFEYSKLMLMNSPFLIVYGWNIKDSNFDADYYPPTIVKQPEGQTNNVIIGNGIGGFWSAAVINLSNFTFSFDTVGHLVGKLTFLNSAGIFLGTLSTEAVGAPMLEYLRTPSEEILKRVGGKENQDFIWSNGIPWSAIQRDEEEAAEVNTFASKSEVLTRYFDINIGEPSPNFSRAVAESIAGLPITAAQLEQVRNSIRGLLELGEEFLSYYRIQFINNLFNMAEVAPLGADIMAKFELLKESTNWIKFNNQPNFDTDGRLYGPNKKFMSRTEGNDTRTKRERNDEIVDSIFEVQIRRAYNSFFLERSRASAGLFDFNFGNIDLSNLDGTAAVGNTITVPMITSSDKRTIGLGPNNSQTAFNTLIAGASNIGSNGVYNSDFDASLYRIIVKPSPGNRVRLVPQIFDEYINLTTPSNVGSESSYIKNMPPFGQDLQRRVVASFSDEKNLNYKNFYGPNRKVVQNVLDLIESTSIISVPVPVTEQDRLTLQEENRTFSEIFGTGVDQNNEPPDPEKPTAMEEVMIEIEFLNPVPPGSQSTGREYDDSLHKVTFHSNDVLFSLKDTVFDDWAEDEIAELKNTQDNTVFNTDGFYAKLRHVITPPESLTTFRFPQSKYAVLKNGWVVSQSKAVESDPWKDNIPGASPIASLDDPTGDPVGLHFLSALLPPESAALVGEGDSAIGYDESLRIRLEDAEEELADTRASSDNYERNRRKKENAARKLLDFQTIIDLQSAIHSAALGSQMMERRDMGIAETDQLATQDDTGQVVHTIMRQPVYHFLGSVLEALRVTTNDKVKFLYSEIVPRKTGEPFTINIPESVGDSVQAHLNSQIANIKRRLNELNDTTRTSKQDAEGNITMVAQDEPVPTTNVQEALAAQEVWDNALLQYIRGRGQDKADLWNPLGIPEGTYRFSQNSRGTTAAVMQRSPTWGFDFISGDAVANSNYKNINQVDIAYTDGFRNIRAPWIYKIGKEGSSYVYDGFQSGGRGYPRQNDYYKQNEKDSYGYMRFWRPEDLDAAIGAHRAGRSFYTRKANGENLNPRGIGHVSFLTDSMGIGKPEGGELGPDYGYQRSYKENGDIREKDGGIFDSIISFAGDLMGGTTDPDLARKLLEREGLAKFSELREVYRVPMLESTWDDFGVDSSMVLNGITSWLNWVPANPASKFTNLSYDQHKYWSSDINGPGGGAPPLAPINADKNIHMESVRNDWYLIKWPGGDMWVKGIVVEDFISFNGIRPTLGNPKPAIGATREGEEDRLSEIRMLHGQMESLEKEKKAGNLNTQFKNLPIRTTYEIPVNIDTIKHFLDSEPKAPLHKLIKKVVAASKETIPAIQLSMRPAPSNPTYIDIFPSAMNYDGIIQEVFTEVDINNSVAAGDDLNIKAAANSVATQSKRGLAKSNKVIVCQFGIENALVETFGLSSKIDPSAFASFRLPAVVGGASMNVSEVLRSTKINNLPAYSSILTDFGDILNNGLTTGMEGLRKLKIVGDGTEGSTDFNSDQLDSFLMSKNPSITKAASSFIENMMSQDVSLYNKILTMQNEFFTGQETNKEGTIANPGQRQAGSKFYGNILSTFLRTANLTIHGTTGLNVFNLVYLKGLLSGIEGLYLISSVNESIAASTFTTTLECKLVEYTNSDPQTNPIAYKGASDLNRLASVIDETKARENVEFGADYSFDELGEFIVKVDEVRGVLQ